MAYNDKDDNKVSKIIAKAVATIILFLILKSMGYSESVPDYKIYIDEPKIYDGDTSVEVQDFSIVYITTDDKPHICYEFVDNGVTSYYDIKTKTTLDSNCIKTVQKFEDKIAKDISIVKKLAKKDELDKEIEKTFEEDAGVRVKEKITATHQ